MRRQAYKDVQTLGNFQRAMIEKYLTGQRQSFPTEP